MYVNKNVKVSGISCATLPDVEYLPDHKMINKLQCESESKWSLSGRRLHVGC